MGTETIIALKDASEGLMYPSETDEPFDVIAWPAGPADARTAVAENGRMTPGAKVEVEDAEAFFSGLMDDPGFKKLKEVVERELSSPVAVRVGDVRIDVYLIGRTPTGAWAGLHTRSVET